MGFPVRRLFVVAVALFYIYMGVCKVSPILSPEMHAEFKSSFGGHARVFPGRLNIKVDPEIYRFTFGVIEIISGALIIIGETIWAVYAVYTLLGMQAFICLSLYTQGESTKCIPSLVALNLVSVLAAGSSGYHYKIE